MRLRPELIGQTLNLYAYSNSNEEFRAIQRVLSSSKVEFNTIPIQSDEKRRRGFKYSIYGQHFIERLQAYLQIRLFGRGNQTRVELSGGNNAYRCIEISDIEDNSDCQTIFADDDHSALFKCALLANQNNWMGGVSEPGTCNL